jgi:hypothetical protein
MRFGLEEEVFVLEPVHPNVQSLYYMSKLLWSNPSFYYSHSATNFNRGPDLRLGLMSSVEISTRICDTPLELIDDLSLRRRDLANATPGYIVAMGSLIDQWAPRNIAGLHIHMSGFDDFEHSYDNIIHFLPLLALLTANAPLANNKPYGKSFRWAEGFAIGPLRDDKYYRFQDVIISKRLGTLEMRLFDSTWDLERIEKLVYALSVVAADSHRFDGDYQRYNELRTVVARYGYVEPIKHLYEELSQLIDIPETCFSTSPADIVRNIYEEYGLENTYNILDNGYRGGKLELGKKKHFSFNPVKALCGFVFYYLPKAPYNIRKVLKEW